MKHTLIALLCALLLLTFSACSTAETSNSGFSQNTNTQNTAAYNNNSTTASIDPFAGLQVSFDGISPYCTISFNNGNCSKEAQQHVQYSVSPSAITTKGTFAIGQNVTVYATLRNGSSDTYALTTSQKTYTVSNVPQYLTQITSDMDLSQFEQELQDYLTSITSWSQGEHAVWKTGDVNYATFVESTDLNLRNSYFSNLKLSKYDSLDEWGGVNYFNRADFLYSIRIGNGFYSDPTVAKRYDDRYFIIHAENLVLFPDGHIGWGEDNPDSLSFSYDYNTVSLSSLENDHIISKKSDYNVSSLTCVSADPK